ncbi:PTS sugar transporter subunit IIC [Latilactobacillus sakei]|uniref:PTS sugar transporter subunit IIC n=1 Tax=Latilactobacillus sakei TaxID=1599 RepID=UPI001F4C276C|nr:PTS sugar transporter subunit IIC [Latilactobacillus sakei]UNC22273.1 hypothetical protein FXV74_10215 [Latilactobacillus sakei]
MFGKALIVGLIGVLAMYDTRLLGHENFKEPLITCTLVGLALGDPAKGLLVGVTLELVSIGIVAVGAAVPPDMTKSPDIIGVTEVQDNDGSGKGGPAANESYERLIKTIQATGGPKYEYKSIDPEMNKDGGQPNANIRVGFLYRPDRVSFNNEIKAGDANTAVDYKDGKLTRNPGRIDPHNPAFTNSRKPLAAQFTFKGQSIIAPRQISQRSKLRRL